MVISKKVRILLLVLSGLAFLQYLFDPIGLLRNAVAVARLRALGGEVGANNGSLTHNHVRL
jgi:hypothetical protein